MVSYEPSRVIRLFQKSCQLCLSSLGFSCDCLLGAY